MKNNGKKFKIEDTWYFQAKRLDLAKRRFCYEIFKIMEPLLSRLQAFLTSGRTRR